MSKINMTLIEKQPVQSVIEQVGKLMEMAKSGELQEIAYVCGYKGNTVNSGWTKLNNRMRIIGELEQIKWHLLKLDE